MLFYSGLESLTKYRASTNVNLICQSESVLNCFMIDAVDFFVGGVHTCDSWISGIKKQQTNKTKKKQEYKCHLN